MEKNIPGGGRGAAPIASGAAALGLAMVVAGLIGGDRLLARADLAPGTVERALSGALALMDLAAGKEIGAFLLGSALIAAALLAHLSGNRPLLSGKLFYVGTVQLICTAAADFAKPPFGRLRPFQALAEGSDRWFMGPDYGSFPSGHAAFYAGLFLPLALLFPRRAAPLLAVPLLVGMQRIVSHDHYASDVGASFLIAGAVAAGLWKWLEPGRLDFDAKAGLPLSLEPHGEAQ
ncbi:MAG TPA: phosphatase PAP2 family protein [Allosphingosinicella sp.]|nr:phosphatase PAP2 family protein [Allosphingosinicella sp.]